MVMQKNGKATPSLAVGLIERLPDEGDSQRSKEEERVAKIVGFILVAYAGTQCT